MPFSAKLLTISPWLVFLLINAFFVVISLLLLFLVRVGFNYQMRQRHNDVASSIFNRAGAIYGIMLAFVVIVLWQQYNMAKDNASKEVTEAIELYRDLSLYPDQKQVKKAAISLLDFVKVVIEDEYPAMARLEMSRKTDQALDRLWADIQRIKPENRHEVILYGKILRDCESLSKLRSERLLEMESNLPGIVWGALIVGAFVTILYAILLGAEKLWLHATLTAMFAIIIATTFFLIIELNYPFVGEVSAKPSNYIKMMETIGKR